MDIEIDRNYLLQTLKDIIAINSVNPSLAAAGTGEEQISNYTAKSLHRCGLKVYQHRHSQRRMSTVGILKGSGSGKSLLLNAHLDTVGVEGMETPFLPQVRGNKLFGRGAYDMKGSVAACMTAAKALRDARIALGGDLIVALVADEEYESIGSSEIIPRYPADAAIVTEPTELNICLAHKGFIWFEVETFGRAAHGSRFQEGIDANMRMGRFLAQLETLERALRTGHSHPLTGPASLHAAMLQGGSGLSTYADHCLLKIERRTIPGETAEAAGAEIQEILDRLSLQDPTFAAEMRVLCDRPAFEVEPGAAIVRTLQESATKVLGRSPAMVGDTPWMDSALFSRAGYETVVFGPRGGGAHSLQEWVDLQSLEDLSEVLAACALSYCR